jgi:hypothetical protein
LGFAFAKSRMAQLFKLFFKRNRMQQDGDLLVSRSRHQLCCAAGTATDALLRHSIF